MEEKGISRAVIKRLPRYYRYLGELLEDGVERISSGELSERMKVTASQIRQEIISAASASRGMVITCGICTARLEKF